MMTFEQIAQAAYQAYCKQAGGKTFSDKPLPPWNHLGPERQACWVAAAKEAVAQFAAVH